MLRIIFAASMLLAAAPAALAEDGSPPAAAPAEEEALSLDELKAKRAEAVEARDAALIQANIYGLPQHRTAAKEKQEEIDELDRQIAELEKAEN